MLVAAFDGALQIKKLNDVFDDNYDGGDFCKGLYFGIESTEISETIYDYYTKKNATKKERKNGSVPSDHLIAKF